MKKYLKNIVQECLKKAKNRSFYFPKIIVLFILLFSITACSTSTASKEWIAKYGDITVPADVYLYYLYQAYQGGMHYLPAKSDAFSQKIEGKDAEEWMKETAINNIKTYILVDKMFEEHNLQSETTLWSSEEYADMIWKDGKGEYKKYGISKQAIGLGDADFFHKKASLLAVLPSFTEDEHPTLQQFFEQQYLEYSIITIPLYRYDKQTKKFTVLEEKEKNRAIEIYKKSASDITLGKVSIKQAAENMQKVLNIKSDSWFSSQYDANKVYQEQYISSSSNLYVYTFGAPSYRTVFLKAMKVGEAKIMVEYNNVGMQDLYLYLKHPIKEKSEAELKALEKVDVIGDRYDYLENQYYQKKTKELTGVTVNEEVFNKYSPKMFEKSKK